MKYLMRFGFIAVVVVAAFAYSAYEKSQRSNEARQAAYARYSYLGDQGYVRGLVDRFHDDCFGNCYRSGGRRRSASFDESQYYSMMDQRVLAQAAADGKVPNPSALLQPR